MNSSSTHAPPCSHPMYIGFVAAEELPLHQWQQQSQHTQLLRAAWLCCSWWIPLCARGHSRAVNEAAACSWARLQPEPGKTLAALLSAGYLFHLQGIGSCGLNAEAKVGTKYTIQFLVFDQNIPSNNASVNRTIIIINPCPSEETLCSDGVCRTPSACSLG